MNNDEILVEEDVEVSESEENSLNYEEEYFKLLKEIQEEKLKEEEEKESLLVTSLDSLTDKNITDYTMIVDDVEVHYLTNLMLEMKTTNFYLSLILIATVVYFISTKLFDLIKSLLRVNVF